MIPLIACTVGSGLTDEQAGMCAEVADLAKGIMALRQSGKPRSDLEAIVAEDKTLNQGARRITMAIIATAYEGWEQHTPPLRQRVVTEFGQGWYIGCAASASNREPPRLRDPEDY